MATGRTTASSPVMATQWTPFEAILEMTRTIRNRSRHFSFSAFQFSTFPFTRLIFRGRLRLSAKADVCFNSIIAARRVTLLYQKISGYFLKVLDEAGVRVSTDPLLALRE
jgi:hypothetical protein